MTTKSASNERKKKMNWKLSKLKTFLPRSEDNP